MLNGDGSENCKKIHRSNQQKKNCERAAHFFVHLLAFVCTTTTYNFQKRRSYICVPVCIFFTAAHFILVAASISHFLTTAIKFSCFSSGRKEIRLLSFISGSCSFSVIHINVDIEIYSKKKLAFLMLFLSKNPGGHEISPLAKFHLCLHEGINVRTFRTRTKFSYPWCSAARTFARTTAPL